MTTLDWLDASKSQMTAVTETSALTRNPGLSTPNLNEDGEFARLRPLRILEEIARMDFDVAAWISQNQSGWTYTAAGFAPEGASLSGWWTVTARFLATLPTR